MKSTKFYRYLTERQKLTFRNVHSGEEIWYVFINRINLFFATLAVIILMFIAILTIVAYTPVLDMIPGYPGNKSRKIIVENLARLDSLEYQIGQWEQYSADLAVILEGRGTLVRDNDSTSVSATGSGFVRRSKSDSLLRQQIQHDPNYELTDRRRVEATFELVAPIKGAVVQSFDPSVDRYGTNIAPQPNQNILAILDGTVVLSSWDPNQGNIIVIQHANNTQTIYKRVGQSLCKAGQRISAGGVIAISKMVVEGKIPTMDFEIWISGNPVDPENFIVF